MSRKSNRKPALVLSTVGTSLLTNPPLEDKLRQLIFATANSGEQQLTSQQKATLDKHLATRSKLLLSVPDQDIKALSAEMNALFAWQQQNPPPQNSKPDQFIFLPTDTYQGQNTARMLVDLLRARGQNADLIPTSGLVTDNLENFRLALSDLTRTIYTEIRPWSDNGYDIIFNLTGGFKGVNAFLQSLGTLVANQIIYIFERSEQLLTIPRLPLSLNGEELILKHIDLFHQMSLGIEIPRENCHGIPTTLLFSVDDHCILSEWGELIWQQARDNLYGSHLMPAMTDYYRYGAQFTKQAQSLPPDRLGILNQRLDDLFHYFNTHQKHCPKSLNFHAIQKTAQQPDATHEFYAFSDQDAKRCYGFFDQNHIFQIQTLGNHL